MTITPILIGGLGNRLYQIANAIRLQEKFNCDLKFYRISPKSSDIPKYRHLVVRPSDFDDFGGHELLIKDGLPKTIDELFPTFNFELSPTDIDFILKNKNLYYENDIDFLSPTKDSVIMGYFFGYSFVKDSIQKVKDSFNPIVDIYINNNYPDLKSKNILGIHLRMGINTDNNPALQVDPNFYSNIINDEKNNIDEIYIVSDNIGRSIEFVKKINTHGKTIKFIDGEPMFVDLLILSKCKTLIIAPSTLSAWSAYMNDHKNIYVPSIWVNHHWTKDISPEWKIL
jgi:hypothetical protein